MKGMSRMKRKLIKGLAIFGVTILGLFIVLVVVTSVQYSPLLVYRTIVNGESSVSDYKVFPERIIAKSEQPYNYNYALDNSLSELQITYKDKGQDKTQVLSEFINSSDTSSLIILKNDNIIYEQYANGYDENSINTSFSMAKSIGSLLIGKAIEDGYIESENQSIADYISEFKGTNMENITIKDLLQMRSDITYEEGDFLWFGDDTYTYWMPDLRKLALNHQKQTEKYGGKFHYNNYHPLLLGIILERSTGTPISSYFEKEIWQKIGTENDASWSLDSDKSGFEKMESGINFRSIDFIKIGSMLIHDGQWNGQQIISKDWIKTSTLCDFPINEDDYTNSHIENRNIGYKYMWYTIPATSGEGYDYFAWGKYYQILYVSPSNNVVILRTGLTNNKVDNWPEVINAIASSLNDL